MARKATEYVQFKLRIRESLRRRIEREAEKKNQSANNEAVMRLEQSFANEGQEALISALVGGGENADLLRAVALNMQLLQKRDPAWRTTGQGQADFLRSIHLAMAAASTIIGGGTVLNDEGHLQGILQALGLPRAIPQEDSK
jgi:hypothetical protein